MVAALVAIAAGCGGGGAGPGGGGSGGVVKGGILRVEGGRVELIGTPARVFRKGREPVDVAPGADLAGLLSTAF